MPLSDARRIEADRRLDEVQRRRLVDASIALVNMTDFSNEEMLACGHSGAEGSLADAVLILQPQG